jgi:hypothetical protein
LSGVTVRTACQTALTIKVPPMLAVSRPTPRAVEVNEQDLVSCDHLGHLETRHALPEHVLDLDPAGQLPDPAVQRPGRVVLVGRALADVAVQEVPMVRLLPLDGVAPDPERSFFGCGSMRTGGSIKVPRGTMPRSCPRHQCGARTLRLERRHGDVRVGLPLPKLRRGASRRFGPSRRFGSGGSHRPR